MPIDPDFQHVLRTGLQGQGVPSDLVDSLISSVSEMIDHYVAGRLRPSELSGGDFAEATFRILQHLSSGSHTARNRSLPGVDRLLNQMEASSLDDSLRIHVPRLLQVIYDVRNRRGVGHLPGDVTANRSDAELLVICAKWVLAEFVRLFHSVSSREAEQMIEGLMQRQLPVVQDFEGTLRIIARRRISVPDQLLVLLYAAEPEQPTRDELIAWSRSGAGVVSTALTRLDDRNLIHRFSDGRIRLTAPGQVDAEEVLRSIT